MAVSNPPLSIEGRYAMPDTNVFQLSQPGTFADPLTDVLHNGARLYTVAVRETDRG